MNKTKRRWGDNDRHFGPLTLSRDRSPRFGITLDSGEEEYPGCCLRAHAFGWTGIVELPPILRPQRRKVTATSWDTATVARLGRDWYWNEHGREFGVLWIDDALHFRYGAQTHDSTTDRSRVWFIPWMNWRHVRRSLYGLRGEHFRTEVKGEPWNVSFAARDACPSMSFEFNDYDGERITAKTRIEEMEWRLGTGWFKWLSLFRRAKIRRSLDIAFSKETGSKKGSWKGGTIGHGIEMQSGELHEAAFRRYCVAHRMTFIAPSGGEAS